MEVSWLCLRAGVTGPLWFYGRNMRMLGAEMDQEAGKINRQKNQKDPKVKQDFEETTDTRKDARYATRSLNHFRQSCPYQTSGEV